MVELRSSARRLARGTLFATLGIGAIAGALAPTEAVARHRHASRGRVPMAHRSFAHVHSGQIHPAHVRPGSYTPPFSVYAVDGNSGRMLYGRDENALRHPASITKVMTLYLLFDQIERGHLSLDTRIDISAHAAAQSPTKLGLRPGSTIRVEDAIKAIVTKSANDMAVAVAERIGGDEPSFARMMTKRAHMLGMSRSNFVNASGLPDDQQLTTARDLVTLGRAIHDHFPRYFRYFSTPSFTYAGQFMPNHNHLMEQVEGMDGIKTGYTRMSGFNLLSSVNRNGHWLVSVVLGGKTRLGRDRIMAELIASEIDKCATTRTAPMVSENPALEQVAEAVPVVEHEGDTAPAVEPVTEDDAEQAPAATPPRQASAAQVRELKADEAAPEPAPEQSRKPRHLVTPVKIAAIEPVQPRPRPAFVSDVHRLQDHDMTATGSIRRHEARDGSTSRYVGAATATPASRHGHHDVAEMEKPVRVASLESDVAVTGRPANAHGWMIQIGATDSIAKANDLIGRAKSQAHGTLGAAHPFTEKVQKGKETLYRARFVGLEAESAANACKSLKRSGFSCFATKN